MPGKNKISRNDPLTKLHTKFQKLKDDITKIRSCIEELTQSGKGAIKLSPEVSQWLAGKMGPGIHDWSCGLASLPPEISTEELVRQVEVLEENVEVFTRITEPPKGKSKKTKR